jgi:hypothetical protein
MGNIIFKIQGSSPEPYVVEITPDPLTLSCTCQAGIMGIPCKHRIHITRGYCNDWVYAPENYDEVLSVIKNAINDSDIPKCLEEYDRLKKKTKEAEANTDKAFKKYRDAVTHFALQETKNDKDSKKASTALDEAIQKYIDTKAETMDVLKRLQEVFVRPTGTNTEELAQAAME